jgi:hypothetical protein
VHVLNVTVAAGIAFNLAQIFASLEYSRNREPTIRYEPEAPEFVATKRGFFQIGADPEFSHG